MRIVPILAALVVALAVASDAQAFGGLFGARTIVNINQPPVVVPSQVYAPAFVPVQAPAPVFVPVQAPCALAAPVASYGIGASYGVSAAQSYGVQANIFAGRGVRRDVVHQHGTHAPAQTNVRFRAVIR